MGSVVVVIEQSSTITALSNVSVPTIVGIIGPAGPAGATGGVPNGGTAGQMLMKLSNTNQHVGWSHIDGGNF